MSARHMDEMARLEGFEPMPPGCEVQARVSHLTSPDSIMPRLAWRQAKIHIWVCHAVSRGAKQPVGRVPAEYPSLKDKVFLSLGNHGVGGDATDPTLMMSMFMDHGLAKRGLLEGCTNKAGAMR